MGGETVHGETVVRTEVKLWLMELVDVGGDVTLGRMGTNPPGESMTSWQDLQHMRWKSGREQWRFSASMRQKEERSPVQR